MSIVVAAAFVAARQQLGRAAKGRRAKARSGAGPRHASRAAGTLRAEPAARDVALDAEVVAPSLRLSNATGRHPRASLARRAVSRRAFLGAAESYPPGS